MPLFAVKIGQNWRSRHIEAMNQRPLSGYSEFARGNLCLVCCAEVCFTWRCGQYDFNKLFLCVISQATDSHYAIYKYEKKTNQDKWNKYPHRHYLHHIYTEHRVERDNTIMPLTLLSINTYSTILFSRRKAKNSVMFSIQHQGTIDHADGLDANLNNQSHWYCHFLNILT